jgi:hypothetical protein
MGEQLPSADPSPDLRRRWQAALSGSDPEAAELGAPWFGWAWPDWIAVWFPSGPKPWPALASCWVLIILLRVFSPSVSAPSASTPNPPLSQVLSILQTADSGQHLPPTRAEPEGAALPVVIEGAGWVIAREISPQVLGQGPLTTHSRVFRRTCKQSICS